MVDNVTTVEQGVDALMARKAPPQADKPEDNLAEDAPLAEEAETEHLVEEHPEEIPDSETAPVEEYPEEIPDSETEELEQAEELHSEPTDELMAQKVMVLDEGQPREITVEEATKSYLRHSDYTRKLQELSAVRQEAAQARDSYLETVEEVRKALDDDLSDELLATNPAEYIRKKERKEKLEAEQRRIAEEQREESETRRVDYIKTQREKTLERIPEWENEEVYSKETAAIKKFAVDFLGFHPSELVNLYDHRALLAMRMAWKAHGAKGKVTTTLREKQVVTTPKGALRPKGKPAKSATPAAERGERDAFNALRKASRRDKVAAGADYILARRKSSAAKSKRG